MDNIQKLEPSVFSTSYDLAIAIKSVVGDFNHVSIVYNYKPNNDEVRILHLAFHHDLRNDVFFGNGEKSSAYYCVKIRYPAKRLRLLANKCRYVWDNNGARIPYGFSSPSGCFSSTTLQYLIGKSNVGLTCSSFVLAMFELAGISLVKYLEWPVGRPGDREWQAHMVKALKESGAPPEHINNIEKEIGSVRYRPEEVAGAGLIQPHPVGFEECCRRALMVLEKIKKM